MTCREVIEFLMAYLADELALQERAVFEAHLVECPPCVRYLESYRLTAQLAREAHRSAEGPPEAPEELVQAILDARRAL